MKKRNLIITDDPHEYHWKSRPSEIRGYLRAYYLTAENGDYVRVDYNIKDKRVRLYIEVDEEGGNAYFSVISNGRITSEKSMASGRSFAFTDKFEKRAEIYSTIPNRDVLRLIKKNYGIGVDSFRPMRGQKGEVDRKKRLEETRRKYFKSQTNPYFKSLKDQKLQSTFKFLDAVDIAVGILLSGIVFILLKSSYIAAGVVAAFFGIIIGMIDLLIRGRDPVFFKVMLFIIFGMILYVYGYYFF